MRRLVIATAVPCALFLAACGQGGASTGTESTSPASSSSTSTPSSSAASSPTPKETSGKGGRATPELLDFTATTVQGESFDGAALAGRPTVLWFWAPWCPTCRGQIPQVEALASDHGGDVNVIGVGSLDSAEAIAAFAGDVDGVTQIEDVDGELWKRFGVTEQSSFVVLDAEGAVSLKAGYGGSDDLEATVESLLG